MHRSRDLTNFDTPGVKVDLLLIEALDEPMALTIARDIPDDAYVGVPVTAQCEHSVPGWHGQRLDAQERSLAADIKREEGQKRHADNIKRAEEQQRQAEIELELRAIAAERVDQRRMTGAK